ncbi:hypothetical protein PIB30_011767 [Stylosanthes scabra]|uniref:Uncharacterized protein n=1 Tax=Stylosanthes scabra TaxID=79078 RepID=A0ABU6Q5S9_9FABA|nr:hypothetical protein [Stylosanthes scabra]
MVGVEQVLNLLDSYWFETTILTNKSLSKLDQNSNQNKVVEEGEGEGEDEDDEVPKAANTLEFRSFSDQNLGSKASVLFDSPSPNSVLTSQKLRTIPSGKDVREFALENEHPVKKNQANNNNIHRRRRRFRNRGNYNSSKSLTELEFQELKGFMDLGFVFTEEDKDSRLVSLIPGLQRLGREEENKNDDDEVTLASNFKPYLSEAWDFYEQREIENNSLLNWRVPAMGNENDMKHNLKSWAHTVASIVR